MEPDKALKISVITLWNSTGSTVWRPRTEYRPKQSSY